MSKFEFLEEVVGINADGKRCHPYKHTVSGEPDKFSYSFESHNRDFKAATAEQLIALIEEGAFNGKGKIRMLPPDSTNTKKNGAMSVAFYKGQPLSMAKKIERKVENSESTGRYWWVNHKQTFKSEFEGGYIWSPKTNKNGARNSTYDNLTRVKPGDVVVSYAHGEIKAIGVASQHYSEAPKPEEFGLAGDNWASSGWLVPIEWTALSTPISPKAHLGEIQPLLPKKSSPLQANGNGNQGCYLAAISPLLGEVILNLIADGDFDVLTAKQSAAVSGGEEMKDHGRLPAEQLRQVTPEYIWEAVQILLQGTHADGYRPSVDYDLLADEGVRLAPKQVFGLAATAALGKDIKPVHFTGGVGTVCFELLEAAGYKIVPKDEQAEPVEIPTDIEEREWAEGQVKLVYHLKRERSPGLSKAKKAAFTKKHGRLFCEECGTDPIEAYGDFGAACIEVHHDAIQVADMGDEHKTTLDQLRCLCANCHRIVHRRLKLEATSLFGDSQSQGTLGSVATT